MNVRFSIRNHPFHIFKCCGFCLTNAIFNYTSSSILLRSNGVYYSSKWPQSAIYSPELITQPFFHVSKVAACTCRNLYTVWATASYQWVQKDKLSLKEPTLLQVTSGLVALVLMALSPHPGCSAQVIVHPITCSTQVAGPDMDMDTLEGK